MPFQSDNVEVAHLTDKKIVEVELAIYACTALKNYPICEEKEERLLIKTKVQKPRTHLFAWN